MTEPASSWFAAWRAAGWAGVAAVALLSLAPVPPEAVQAAGGDKLVHFAGYALLGAWFGQLRDHRARPMRLLAGLLALGLGLEALQGVVPWREADALDALANTAGAAAGVAASRGRGGRLLERLSAKSRAKARTDDKSSRKDAKTQR